MAVTFLMKQGYRILECAHDSGVGMIDVIAEKEGIIHFIDVKGVTRETLIDVKHETSTFVLLNNKKNREELLHMKHAMNSFITKYDLIDFPIQNYLLTITFYKTREVPRINHIENVII